MNDNNTYIMYIICSPVLFSVCLCGEVYMCVDVYFCSRECVP